MRTARLLGTGRSFYHVMSRVVDRRMVFEAKDKEIFRKILRNQEAFSGVRIVTYCLMSNHFHLLLEVPDRETLAPLDEEGLLAVLPLLYEGHVVEGVKQELERARAAGDERWHREILSRYERRRGDLGLFLKEVKLRITFYMNKRLGRTGTLWEGRYKSVLVEDCEQALMTIAAYIDLNPIRAGIVSSPEDYRWCGYAEAVGGGRRALRAREGLGLMLAESLQDPGFRQDWRRTAARYRVFLYLDGQEIAGDPERGQRGRRGMKAEVVEAVVDQGGAMPVREVLRHRVRYFCDGAVLGTAAFGDGVRRPISNFAPSPRNRHPLHRRRIAADLRRPIQEPRPISRPSARPRAASRRRGGVMAPAFPAHDHEPGIACRPNRPRKSLIQALISLRFLE